MVSGLQPGSGPFRVAPARRPCPQDDPCGPQRRHEPRAFVSETPLARSREELGGPRCRQNSAVGGGGCKRGPEAGLGPGLQGPHPPDRQAWIRRLRSSGPPRGRFSDRGTAHDASESPARGPRAMTRDRATAEAPHGASKCARHLRSRRGQRNQTRYTVSETTREPTG